MLLPRDRNLPALQLSRQCLLLWAIWQLLYLHLEDGAAQLRLAGS